MEAATTLAGSIIASRLDYCNSILLGVSNYNISRLQRVQNNIARVVCRSPARSCANSLLQRLHWLPVAQRIKYKASVLAYIAITLVHWCILLSCSLGQNQLELLVF